MIKRRIGPGNRVVASVAGLREAGGDVIRNIASQGLRAGPVGSVARVAGR